MQYFQSDFAICSTHGVRSRRTEGRAPAARVRQLAPVRRDYVLPAWSCPVVARDHGRLGLLRGEAEASGHGWRAGALDLGLRQQEPAVATVSGCLPKSAGPMPTGS